MGALLHTRLGTLRTRKCTIGTSRLLHQKRTKKTQSKSLREHAKDLGIPPSSVSHAVSKNLNGESLVRKFIPLLTQKNNEARLERCKRLEI